MKDTAIGFILGFVVAAAVCAYNTLSKVTPPSILAQPSKELDREKTETLTCKPVVVYRDRVKKDLGLPETVVKDPDKKVTASTKVPASEYPNTVTSIFDTGTGATDLYVRRDKLPWIARNTRYELGIGYGYTKDGPVTRLDGTVDVLQLKALHMGLVGTVDSSGAFYSGGRIWIRW